MVLSAFVYLQTSDKTPAIILQHSEIASCYWVPITYLASELTPWSPVEYSMSSIILRSRNHHIDIALKQVVGGISFYGIPIPTDYRHSESDSEMSRAAIQKQFPLWGLTLWMTSDLLDLMGYASIAHKGSPRYSAFDVNLILKLLSARREEPYLGTVEYRWGLSTQSAVRIATGISLGLRLAIGYKLFKIIKRFLA